MPKLLESAKKIGAKIGLDEEKGFAVAVFFAIIVVASVISLYYIVVNPQPEEYNTIYLLDVNKQAKDYPQVLIANQNSTFSVYVGVENHMNNDQSYQVQTKIVENLPTTFPLEGISLINSYEINLSKGEYNQQLVTVTENEIGSYVVVFELYRVGESGSYEFTQNYSVLNIKVIN